MKGIRTALSNTPNQELSLLSLICSSLLSSSSGCPCVSLTRSESLDFLLRTVSGRPWSVASRPLILSLVLEGYSGGKARPALLGVLVKDVRYLKIYPSRVKGSKTDQTRLLNHEFWASCWNVPSSMISSSSEKAQVCSRSNFLINGLKQGNRLSNYLSRLPNSAIFDVCQAQSAKDLALLWEQAYQDNTNDSLQPLYVFQVICFPVLFTKCLSRVILIHSKGNLTSNSVWLSGVVGIGFDEPVLMATPKPLLTDFGICQRSQHSLLLQEFWTILYA